MKFLITNDDGIHASGIKVLVKHLMKYGEVVVVAPIEQCSAYSHSLTISKDILVKEMTFEVEGVKAYGIGGTPADCVKVATEYLKLKPDCVFSGINNGYNVGIDIAYSGTIAAAQEAKLKGFKAFAYSKDFGEDYEIVDAYFDEIYNIVMKIETGENEIINVNFPPVSLKECKGYITDRKVCRKEYFKDTYTEKKVKEETYVKLDGSPSKEFDEGSDTQAILEGYISIGKVKNYILGQ